MKYRLTSNHHLTRRMALIPEPHGIPCIISMMPLEHAELEVRSLPDGLWHAGLHRGLVGRLLSLEVADLDPSQFASGSLVEVNWDKTTYLGQVYGREDRVLVIGVEHAVDREPLSALQAAWRPVRF